MAIENANPTVLTTIPTRHTPSRRRTGPGHEFDRELYARPHFLSDGDSDSEAEVWWDGDLGEEGLSKGYGAAHDDEPIDAQEVYDLVCNIADPEHPLTLGQLAVVNLAHIDITPSPSPASALVYVTVDITPTISHCSHATIIGLAVRVRLERCLPPTHRVEVRIREGTHAQDGQVTKQLADKERVAAALENATLSGVLDTMLGGL